MIVGSGVWHFKMGWLAACTERNKHPNEVAEMALSHAVGDKVEAAYSRGDLFDKRVALMRDRLAFLMVAHVRS